MSKKQYVATARGFISKIYMPGEPIPANKVPKGGASWISEVDAEGNKKTTVKKVKVKSAKKVKVKDDSNTNTDADATKKEANADTDISEEDSKLPNLVEIWEGLDPAEDDQWNADGSPNIKKLNDANGTKFTKADLGEDMTREELAAIKANG